MIVHEQFLTELEIDNLKGYSDTRYGRVADLVAQYASNLLSGNCTIYMSSDLASALNAYGYIYYDADTDYGNVPLFGGTFEYNVYGAPCAISGTPVLIHPYKNGYYFAIEV